MAKTASAVGLLEAAEDKALFGLQLSERQRELFSLIETSNTVIASCGRQSGKTLSAAVTAVWNLLLRPDLNETARGSARHVIVVANSREQARITLAFAREFCERSPLLRSELLGVREDKLVFQGARTLLAVPCADRVARGLRASALIFDEAGHFLSEAYGPRTLERLYVALRPSLITFGERGKVLMASTPGESGFFTSMFQKAEAGELPGGASFTAPTVEMNPLVDPSFLAGERESLGEADFRREYLGEFVAGGSSAFFSEEDLRACVGRYRTLEPAEGTGWVLGLDPSFSSDPSGIAIVGRAKDDRKRLLVALTERWQPERTRRQRRAAKTDAERKEVQSVVLDRVAELSRAYGGAPVVSDAHLAGVVREELRARGVERVVISAWNAKTLTQAFRGVRAQVLSASISFPDDTELLAELLRVRTRTRSGQPTIELPRSVSSHCDRAAAVASACLYLETKGIPSRAKTFSSFKVPERIPDDRRSPSPVAPKRRSGSAFAQAPRFSEARLQREHGGAFSPGVTRGPQA